MLENVIPPWTELKFSSTPIGVKGIKLSVKWTCDLSGQPQRLFASRDIWKQWKCIHNAHRVHTWRRRKYWYNQALKWSKKV